jgi:surface protein
MSPIYINNKKIESIYINNQSIGKVYVGDVLVFQKNNYTGDPFIFTIDTTKGTGNSFDLPLRSGYNYNMLVDWGDGNTDVITSYNQAEKLHTYSTGGVYTISITGLCEAWFSYFSADSLKLTSIDQWGNTGFVNMQRAFYGCNNLTTVNDTDGTWCSNVISMIYMFFGCSSLTTLDVSNWDVSNVANMTYMFFGCSSLTTLDVSNWDVSKVTDMYYMFYNTPLDTASYDALLIGWSQLPSLKSNVNFNANLAKYSSGAATTARGILTSAPNYWKIYDAGQL